MSSRNERLSETAKENAAIIYQILNNSKEIFKTNSTEETINWVENEFKKHPEFQLEYFEIADEASLLPVSQKVSDNKYRGFIAIFIENIRLIDNISLN
jgi:pantoate--beta-alanine ligase